MLLPDNNLQDFLYVIWLAPHDFYKGNKKPTSVDGINVGIVAASPWIPTVEADFSRHFVSLCGYVIAMHHLCGYNHFCLVHDNDVRVNQHS